MERDNREVYLKKNEKYVFLGGTQIKGIMSSFKKENFTVLQEKIPSSLRMVAIYKLEITLIVFVIPELRYKHGLLARALVTKDRRYGV